MSLATRILVLAHVLGLGFGLLFGPLLPYLVARGGAEPRSQAWLGLATLGLVALAWGLALG